MINMIKLFYENIITDLRKQGVVLSKDAFNTLNTFIDIQNSTVSPLTISNWRDTKGKTILVSDSGNVVAVYDNDKFIYNPNKLKVSNLTDYDLFEITVGMLNVQKRREQRRDYKSGLVSPKDSEIPNLPKSSSLVWLKDFDPEVNKRYYTKLLRQNNLSKYTSILDNAYDIVSNLIIHRKAETTIGKRTVYNDMINKLVGQIRKIEDLINGIDKDFNDESFDSIGKEMKKLSRIVKDAQDLIKTEDDTIRRFGQPKTRPHTKIEK